MKKNINIDRKIYFSSMIGDICAISLEQDLKFVDDYDIEGNLIVSGRYKATVASQIEEDFSEKIPIEIALVDKVDTSTCKIDIVDFTYKIIDSSNLQCNIVLSIEGDEILDEVRECDGDPADTKEIEIPKLEDVPIAIDEIEPSKEEPINNNDKDNDNELNIINEKEEIETEDMEEINDNTSTETNTETNTVFNITGEYSEETYGTFIVYMIRQNETINSILEKYNTTVEEIEKYNDIKDLSIGTKLIIPILNDENK